MLRERLREREREGRESNAHKIQRKNKNDAERRGEASAGPGERGWPLFTNHRVHSTYTSSMHITSYMRALGASASIGRCTDSGPVNTHYGITHSILQFTECLYYGHSTLALGTRVRTATLVPNDPRHRSSLGNSSNFSRVPFFETRNFSKILTYKRTIRGRNGNIRRKKVESNRSTVSWIESVFEIVLESVPSVCSREFRTRVKLANEI